MKWRVGVRFFISHHLQIGILEDGGRHGGWECVFLGEFWVEHGTRVGILGVKVAMSQDEIWSLVLGTRHQTWYEVSFKVPITKFLTRNDSPSPPKTICNKSGWALGKTSCLVWGKWVPWQNWTRSHISFESHIKPFVISHWVDTMVMFHPKTLSPHVLST